MAGSQRQRLLFGVTVVVADRGYLTATVADIAAAAKVSRRTFYQHFPDKEAVLNHRLPARSIWRPPWPGLVRSSPSNDDSAGSPDLA
ncbi:TetR family transcriptional regulator [Nocardia exalbida]|uniref:TetR family transcriptional regulator n=1 Tax=Nocardia exalbida TaxID=290231 RepID=UPI0012F64762|nr:TetR/AcrR family transcriptional regulator [Nocardia exalbida]